MRDDPELALGVEDDGDGFEERGSDGPAATEELDGVVGRAAALEVDGEVQIAERWERHRREFRALFLEGELEGHFHTGGDFAQIFPDASTKKLHGVGR